MQLLSDIEYLGTLINNTEYTEDQSAKLENATFRQVSSQTCLPAANVSANRNSIDRDTIRARQPPNDGSGLQLPVKSHNDLQRGYAGTCVRSTIY